MPHTQGLRGHIVHLEILPLSSSGAGPALGCATGPHPALWNLHPRAGLDPALGGHLLPFPPGQILYPRSSNPSPQCPASTPSPIPYPAGKDAAPQEPPTNPLRGGGAASEGSHPQELIPLRMGPHPDPLTPFCCTPMTQTPQNRVLHCHPQ